MEITNKKEHVADEAVLSEADSDNCDYLCIHPEVIDEVTKNLPSERTVGAMADFFKAFSDPTRVRILCALWEHELCVCDISTLLGMTQSAISHQLRFLRQARLIKSRREGKAVFYSLADEHVQSIINCAKDHINE